MAYKGKYRPKNVSKYDGDPTNIIYRSSWECRAFRYCDMHPDIVSWGSETVVIPYVSPKDKRIHRYFVDLIIRVRQSDGSIKTMLIEIKPEKQMAPPDPSRRNATKTGRVSTRYLREAATYSINDAKWNAAQAYCDKKGWLFVKWGERHIKALSI